METIEERFEIVDRELSEKEDYPVYLAKIKEEERYQYGGAQFVIIKKIEEAQAQLYKTIQGLHHPNLETIYEVVELNHEYYAINEYIERPSCLNYGLYDQLYNKKGKHTLSLEEFLYHDPKTREDHFAVLETPADGKFMKETYALSLAYQLCEALLMIRKTGNTHGDLSPQNIMITNKTPWQEQFQEVSRACPYTVKLIDFETAKEQKKENHAVTRVLGTKAFVAPEIIDPGKPSDRMDIYSVGCVLNYMCLGTSPKEQKRGLEDSKEQLSKDLYSIVKKCLSDYEIRYTSLERLMSDIKKCMDGTKHPIRRVFSYIPGFRSGKIWKMCIASYMYLSIFTSFISLGLMEKDIEIIRICLLLILEIFFIFDPLKIGTLSKKYTYYSQKYSIIRWSVKILIGIMLLLFYLILY